MALLPLTQALGPEGMVHGPEESSRHFQVGKPLRWHPETAFLLAAALRAVRLHCQPSHPLNLSHKREALGQVVEMGLGVARELGWEGPPTSGNLFSTFAGSPKLQILQQPRRLTGSPSPLDADQPLRSAFCLFLQFGGIFQVYTLLAKEIFICPCESGF